MNKRTLLITVGILLLHSAVALAQNTPTFFYGNDHLKKKNFDKNNRVLLTSANSKRATRYSALDGDVVKYSNSYFIFKKGALDTANVNKLNKYFYNQNQLDIFQTTSIQNFTSNRNTTINAEVFSANFGPVRFGLSGSFQTTGDTTQDNAIKTSVEKIRSNGGTFSVNGILPLMFLRSKSDAYHMGLFAQQQFGLLPNSIDTNGKTEYTGANTSFTGQSGIFLHMDAGSKNDKDVNVRLYADVSYYYVYGNYYDVLNMADFGFMGLKVGCVVGDLLNFNASGALFSSSVAQRSAPFTISLQFSPSQVATAIHDKNSDDEDDTDDDSETPAPKGGDEGN